MGKSFDYEQRAKECAQHAETAANGQARKVWQDMQAYWLKRAAESGTSFQTNASAKVSS